MEGEYLADVEPVEDAFFHHDTRSAAGLFGGLENQRDAACEIAGLSQIAGGAKQHRRMPVMPAGVHFAVVFRGIVRTGVFLHWQGVHVGAQPDGRPVPLTVDDRHNARGGDTGVDFINAKRFQMVDHIGRRVMAVEPDFRVLVDMLAPFRHVVGKSCDAVQDGHGWTLFSEKLGSPQENPKPEAAAMDQTASDAIVHDETAGMERLLEIMRRLRHPEKGCPWDVEQDFATIAPYTIEEAYEVADAIEREAWEELRSELGDLLFQSVFHAQMAEEAGHFSFNDVVKAISDKMVFRHPHVFGEEGNDFTADAQVDRWEEVKAKERAAKAEHRVLDGVAVGLPALLRAVKLQKRAARVGFDWPSTDQVLDKIIEESHELVEARDELSQDEIEEEMGDLLFVVANLARHLEVDPEAALRRTNAKFVRRFNAIEDALAAKGSSPEESDLEEMDALWDAAKLAERQVR